MNTIHLKMKINFLMQYSLGHIGEIYLILIIIVINLMLAKKKLSNYLHNFWSILTLVNLIIGKCNYFVCELLTRWTTY